MKCFGLGIKLLKAAESSEETGGHWKEFASCFIDRRHL